MGQAAWRRADGTLHVNVAEAGAGLVDAVHAAQEAGVRLTAVSVQEPNLETVFLELTGRALRD
jgi:ABC-2 type transport system ATP-binding protein